MRRRRPIAGLALLLVLLVGLILILCFGDLETPPIEHAQATPGLRGFPGEMSTPGRPPTLAAGVPRAAESPPTPRPAAPPSAPEAPEPSTPPPPPPRVVKLRVDLVDADSGTSLEGEWTTRVPLGLRSGRIGREELFVASGTAQEVALEGDVLRQDVVLRPPPGRWTYGDRIRAEAAAGVSELVVRQPVSYAVSLRLSVRDAEGRVATPGVAAVFVSGRPVPVVAAFEDSETVVTMPFHAEADARVWFDWTPSSARGSRKNYDDPDWKGRLPTSPFAVTSAEVRLTPPSLPPDDGGDDLGLVLLEKEPVPEPSRANEEPRTMTVRFVAHDERPISDGWIVAEDTRGRPLAVARPDGDGKAVLSGPLGRSVRLRAIAPGRLRASGEVRVPDAADAVTTIREPKGASLEVFVVGMDERPLPFARVRPEALVFDVEDGAQRVDLRTDAVGRRTFARVQSGRCRVTASWGDRRGDKTVYLVDGQRQTLRISVR